MNNYNIAAPNGDSQYGGANSPIQIVTANVTLSAADAGKTFLVATDALTITLPASVAGCQYTFINHGAAGNNIITVAPQAVDGIAGTITLASSVVTRVGTVNTALVNTKATSTKGNAVTIIGTGITGTGAWYIKESTGIWA
jgi:hypothetical protein